MAAPLLGAAGPVSSPAPMVITVMAVPFATPHNHPNGGLEPAPVPNTEASEPLAPTDPAKTEWSPTIFSAAKKQFRGDGFVADSTEQVAQQRNYRPAGGFKLKMPLQ